MTFPRCIWCGGGLLTAELHHGSCDTCRRLDATRAQVHLGGAVSVPGRVTLVIRDAS